MTALLLGLLGLLLSLVVPAYLAKARWPDRAPGGAVVLWQAITLAAVLSALGVVFAAPQEFTQAIGSVKPVMAGTPIGPSAWGLLVIGMGLPVYYFFARKK